MAQITDYGIDFAGFKFGRFFNVVIEFSVIEFRASRWLLMLLAL
jgi:hypothetical protein